jgi:hypothetical protein
MGTYGIGIYGIAKYGTDIHPEFDVSPFTATPTDYTSVLLDWRAPAGSWDTLRLIRNRYGWAVDENDGEILLEEGNLSSSFLDTGVAGGSWLYYTIFISASGQWSRAGTASVLMPKNNGYADLLYSLVPDYYKIDVKDGNAATDDSNTINPYLMPFLSIFGFGFDIVKSYYDSNRYTNDAMRTHIGNIPQIAAQFGIHYEPSTPAYLFRQRMRDAATLGRQKGTLEQLRSLISQTTGYDVDLSIGNNLMLSDDQASFNHPKYPNWDPGVNYATGERVKFGSYLYQAGSNGAFGQAQAPTGTNSSNAFWTIVSLTSDTTLLNANGNIAGWEEISFTAGVSPGTNAVQVGVGAQSPTNPSDNAGNALIVKNNNSGAVTASMGVRSVARINGQGSMDPQQPVLWGIPMPWVSQAWDNSVYYQPGDLVIYHGRTYEALTASLNAAPSDNATANAQWQPLAYDERTQVCLSGYTQAYNGEQVQVYPFVEFYDSHGALICSLYADQVPSYTVLDTFTQGWSDWTTRNTDVGALAWTQKVGQWTAGGFANGSAYPKGTSRSLATVTGHADGAVSVTFAVAASGTLQQGVIFRYQDLSNYWRAGRGSLYRISGGVTAATFPYSQAFSDGDRITVSFSGSNISVNKNGTQVLSISDSNLLTATGVGMVVE